MARQNTPKKKWLLVWSAGVALATAIGAPANPATAARSSLDAQVQAIKSASARYHSLHQAQMAGYSWENEPCVESPSGAMGIHAVNPALVADPAIDPLHPETLLYLPDAHGRLKLIGVEYFMVDADQNLATDGDRPLLFGTVPFDGPMPGHNPTMPIHYDLHLWVWADNPSGVFAPFNPTLACPA